MKRLFALLMSAAMVAPAFAAAPPASAPSTPAKAAVSQPKMKLDHFRSDPAFVAVMQSEAQDSAMAKELMAIHDEMASGQGHLNMAKLAPLMQNFIEKHTGTASAIAMADRFSAACSIYARMSGEASYNAGGIWAAGKGLQLCDAWEKQHGTSEAMQAFRVDFLVPLVNLGAPVPQTDWKEALAFLRQNADDPALLVDTRCMDLHRLTMFTMLAGDAARVAQYSKQGEAMAKQTHQPDEMQLAFLLVQARMAAAQGTPKAKNDAYQQAKKTLEAKEGKTPAVDDQLKKQMAMPAKVQLVPGSAAELKLTVPAASAPASAPAGK